MKNFYLLLLIIPFYNFAQIVQVKDIFPGSVAATPPATVPVQNSGNPTVLFDYNGMLLFRATDGSNGVELWKSDGTAAGTILVKDINTAANSNGNPANFTLFGGNVFFSATTGTSVTGTELYKTDGTSSGTVLIKDINVGTANGNPSNLTVLTPTLMVFGANDGTTGVELFKTDGTASGTINVVDYPGASGSISWIETFGTNAIMGQIAGSTGRELYKSDGTMANSSLILDINPGITVGGVGTDYIKALGQIFFAGNSGSTGLELWKTDGTAANTVLVKDINTVIVSSSSTATQASSPKRFATLGNSIYFNAVGANGSELWKSDGTAAGTTEVMDINPGVNGGNPDQIATANGAIYYFASDNGTNNDLYKFDGITNTKLFDFNALSATVVTNFVVSGTLVYFAADSNADAKRELWQTDGTAAGTVAVASLNSLSLNATAVNFVTVVGNKIFFSAEFSEGVELFAYSVPPLSNASFDLSTLNIYPNPTTGIINVGNEKSLPLSYKLYDVLGKIINSGKIVNNQLDINAERGVYFLELTSEIGKLTKKIIKN